MNISKEELESVSSDLASLTDYQTEAIVSGEEPSARAILLFGGGNESDNSVRRRYATDRRKEAWNRLTSKCVLLDDKQQIEYCIKKLDAFIAEIPEDGV